MIWIAEKRSPCIPPLLAEPFMGERTDDLETVFAMIQTNPRSMWQYGDHVLIQRDGTSITVAPIRVKWLGAHSPQVMFDPERAVGGLYEIEDMGDEDRQHLVILIRMAERRRKASLRRCAACGESHPFDELTGRLCGPCFEHSGGVH